MPTYIFFVRLKVTHLTKITFGPKFLAKQVLAAPNFLTISPSYLQLKQVPSKREVSRYLPQLGRSPAFLMF